MRISLDMTRVHNRDRNRGNTQYVTEIRDSLSIGKIARICGHLVLSLENIVLITYTV